MRKKTKEIPIGEIGVIDGYRVTAKEYTYKDDCGKCCFSSTAGYRYTWPINKCSGRRRNDGKHGYFEVVKKGE